MANWIAGAIRHPGAFTAKAKAAGEGVQEYARNVLGPKSHADTKTKRQASLARTLGRMSRR